MLKQFSTGLALVATGTISLAAVWQTPPQPAQPTPPPSQPTEIELIIGGLESGAPPKYAVPDFLALSNDRETTEAAKTIGEVLFRDLEFEREFYLIARDTYRSIPRASSIDTIQFDRWRELGADAVVSGAVWRTEKGISVQVRLYNVRTQQAVLAREYAGSAATPRLYAHTMADEIHQHQRALRGVARTKLTFTSDRDGENLGGPVGDRAIQEIYIADYDGFNQRRVTVGRNLNLSPVWSPDSKALAYTSYRRGFPDILVSFIYQGKLEYPTRGTDRNHNFLPAWSPDGSQIAFVSNRDGNAEIYVVNADGSNVRRITNHPSIDVTPTWSPTGNQLAFTSDRSGSPQIYMVGAEGAGLRRVTTESYCDRPTWSPAPFNEIAYASRTGPGYDIKIYDIAQGTIRQITSGEGSNESPAFAPNGRHLAFTSTRNGKAHIFTIARDGKDVRQVTREGNNRYPNWSPR
jgi:TolB protein